MDSRTIAGERIDLLMRALARFEWVTRRSGMVSFSAELDPEVGEPLRRAITTVERELLEADRAEGVGAKTRTAEQRRADAFVALVLRLADVVGA